MTLRQNGSASGWLRGLLVILGAEGIGCQAGALSVLGWAFVLIASADFLGSFHSIP